MAFNAASPFNGTLGLRWFKREWNLDGERWDQLYPADAYTAGNELWARHDRAVARAAAGDEQARLQARRLLEAIRPATFEDLTEKSGLKLVDQIHEVITQQALPEEPVQDEKSEVSIPLARGFEVPAFLSTSISVNTPTFAMPRALSAGTRDFSR